MPTISPERPELTKHLLFLGVLVGLIAALTVDARATYGARTTSDEPQYLLSALSLAEDFDLDISDEIENERYLPFHEVPLNEQTKPLNDSGQRISPHDPLLPVLLAVPIAVGGWVGAKLFLAAVAGVLAAATLWLAVRRFGVDRNIATVVVGAFHLSPPLISYGTQVYPELPAALVVTTAVIATTGSLRPRAIWVALLCVVALPWLSIKYGGVALALAVLLFVRLYQQDRSRELLTALGALAAAGIVYLAVHQGIYGGWTVYASGDHFVTGEFGVVGFEPDYWGRSKRIYGLLVDRGFGLAAWAPAFLLLPAALGHLLRSRPNHWLTLTAPLIAGWLTAVFVAFTMHGWWWPGRQLVVVLPLAVVMIAIFAECVRSLLWPISIAGVVGAFGWLWLVVEASTDRRTLIVDFEDTSNPIYQVWSALLPDHHRWPSGTMAMSIVWCVLIVGFAVWGWRRAGTKTRETVRQEQPV